MTNSTTDRLAEVLEKLRKVEGSSPDSIGISTMWHRNPDGPEAANFIQAQQAEIERLNTELAEHATDLDKAQQRIAELEAALAASKQGWDNVLEFRLIADNHRTAARTLSDDAFIALNQPKESGND